MQFDKPSRKFNFLLLGLIAYNFLPHGVEHFLILLSFGVSSLLWRLAYEYQKIPLPNFLGKAILVALGVGVVFSIYGDLRSVESSTAILLTAASLKMLDNVEYRDAMVVLMLSFFVLMTGFLQSQTLAMTIFGGIDLVLITAIMFQLHKGKSLQLDFWYMMKLGGKLSLMITPLLVLLFFIFPRITTGILSNTKQKAKSGFSDNLDAGGIDQLALSNETAFRVKFLEKAPRQSEMYWRGASFSVTEGLKWKKGHKFKDFRPSNTDISKGSNPYNITMESKYGKWLFFLDYPGAMKFKHWRYYKNIESNGRGEFRLKKPLGQLLQYKASRNLSIQFDEVNVDLSEYLQLPDSTDSEILEYVKKISLGSSSTRDVLGSIEREFSKNYKYSLDLKGYESNNLSDFLLKNRVGFCEHFAASLAYLLRLKSIPTRVVVGFHGAKKNSLSDYYIVSQRDAHAWTEVYFKETGKWERVDPTAWVAPMRISLGGQMYHGLSKEELKNVKNADDYYLKLKGLRASIERLSLLIDMAEERWNYFLLNFDFEAQKKLFSKIGINIKSRKTLWLISMVLIAIFFIGLRWRELRKIKLQNHPVDIAWAPIDKLLSKNQFSRASNEGMSTFLNRIGGDLPEHNSLFTKLSTVYIELKYAKNSSYELKNIKELYSDLKKVELKSR